MATRDEKGRFVKGHKPWHKNLTKKMFSSISRLTLRKERSIDAFGYYRVWHDGKKVLEHHKVWCDANNMGCVPRNMIVHHVNENKLDNHPKNLVLLDKATHAKLHYFLHFKEDERRKYWGVNASLVGDYYG